MHDKRKTIKNSSFGGITMFVIMFRNLPYGPFESKEAGEKILEDDGWQRETNCTDRDYVIWEGPRSEVWVKKRATRFVASTFHWMYASVEEVKMKNYFP